MIAQLNHMAHIWWQWMGGMFWQVSLLILLVSIIDMAIRRWAWPQVRYVLWGLVFLKLVIPPTWQMPTSVVSWLQPRLVSQISIQIEPVDTDTDLPQEPEPIEPIQIQDEVIIDDEFPFWQAALLLTWFCGMGAFLLVLSIRMARLRKRHRNSGNRHLPDWFHETLSNTAECMKLKKIPAVVFSENGTGPAVYGLFRPVLVLPDGYLEKLSKEQVRHVLLHELCHLKRGDLLVHWCCLTLQAVYWFNPFVLWTRRQMRHVCEICCDLSVANILREKTPDYRNTLLFSARDLFPETPGSSLGLLGIFEEPFRLVSRLKWLEKNTWEKPWKKKLAVVFTLLAMVFLVMPMNGLSRTGARNETPPPQPLDTSQPINFKIETLIFDVDEETDFDIESLEMEKDRVGFVYGKSDGITVEGDHYPDLETAKQGLSNTSGVKILSMPQIVTFNNKTATIKQGDGAGFQSEPAPHFESEDMLMKITPQLLEDGRISQHILLNITWTIGERMSTDQVETDLITQAGEILAICVPITDGLSPGDHKRYTEALATGVSLPDGESLNYPKRYILVSSSVITRSEPPLPDK